MLAGDAQGALVSALKVPPDLVITTMTLPAVDGWSWWERLRTRPQFAMLPILFLKPSPGDGAVAGDAVRGFEKDRDGQLAKPFRIEDLERAIQRLVGGDERHSPTPTSPRN